MAVHHAVGINRQRNSGYRPSRVNMMAQGLSTPDPSLSPTHLSIRRGRTTTTHYTHHQVSLMVSRNTTLVPSLGLCIGPACEAGLSTGMRREHVPPRIRKKKKKESGPICIKFCRLVQNDMLTVVIWSKSKSDVEFQYGRRLVELNGMSSQSHLPHCKVLPPLEFNVMIP